MELHHPLVAEIYFDRFPYLLLPVGMMPSLSHDACRVSAAVRYQPPHLTSLPKVLTALHRGLVRDDSVILLCAF